jgi:hypothetical protein
MGLLQTGRPAGAEEMLIDDLLLGNALVLFQKSPFKVSETGVRSYILQSFRYSCPVIVNGDQLVVMEEYAT